MRLFHGCRRVVKKPAVGIFLAVALCAAVAPAAAHSAKWYNKTNWSFYQGFAEYTFTYHYAGNNLYDIDNMKIKRWLIDPKGQVCDHRARTKITVPSGHVYDDLSSERRGCRFYIAQEGMGQTDGRYPSGSTYRSYWKDTNTGDNYRYVKGVTIRRT